MLNVLRENFKNRPYLKWVLGLVAAGLVLYLGNYFIGNQSGGGDWALQLLALDRVVCHCEERP